VKYISEKVVRITCNMFRKKLFRTSFFFFCLYLSLFLLIEHFYSLLSLQ